MIVYSGGGRCLLIVVVVVVVVVVIFKVHIAHQVCVCYDKQRLLVTHTHSHSFLTFKSHLVTEKRPPEKLKTKQKILAITHAHTH